MLTQISIENHVSPPAIHYFKNVVVQISKYKCYIMLLYLFYLYLLLINIICFVIECYINV